MKTKHTKQIEIARDAMDSGRHVSVAICADGSFRTWGDGKEGQEVASVRVTGREVVGQTIGHKLARCAVIAVSYPTTGSAIVTISR